MRAENFNVEFSEEDKAAPEEQLTDMALFKHYSQLLEDPSQLNLPGSQEENLRFILDRAKNAAKGFLDKDAKDLLDEKIKKYENFEKN